MMLFRFRRGIAILPSIMVYMIFGTVPKFKCDAVYFTVLGRTVDPSSTSPLSVLSLLLGPRLSSGIVRHSPGTLKSMYTTAR